MRRLYHWGKFEVRPETSPLNKGEREILNVESTLREMNLALGYSLEQPVLVVRPPSKKILDGFRLSNAYELRPSKIQSFPFKWVELN